jgi:putative FmdB family regulatory protein
MPTYEYECRKCGNRFEHFQSITSEPLKKCPRCNGRVRRLISAGAGIIFKGQGFFATDYRSSSYREGEKKEKEVAEPKKEKKKDTVGKVGSGS